MVEARWRPGGTRMAGEAPPRYFDPGSVYRVGVWHLVVGDPCVDSRRRGNDESAGPAWVKAAIG